MNGLIDFLKFGGCSAFAIFASGLVKFVLKFFFIFWSGNKAGTDFCGSLINFAEQIHILFPF